MKKQLVITADDLGISPQTNEAVARACDQGILTSTSLLANGAAFEEATQCLRSRPNLGVGVHFCLTSLNSVLPAREVPLLVRSDGRFRYGLIGIWRLLKSRQKREAEQQVSAELKAQIEKVLAAGVAIDHLDSHQHVHMIPGVFSIVVELAQRYGQLAVRLCRETQQFSTKPTRLCLIGAFRRLLLNQLGRKNASQLGTLPKADAVWGIERSGRIDNQLLQDMIRAASEGVTEIIVHPAEVGGFVPPSLGRADRKFLDSVWRQTELHALLDADLSTLAREQGVELINFRDAFHATAPVSRSCA